MALIDHFECHLSIRGTRLIIVFDFSKSLIGLCVKGNLFRVWKESFSTVNEGESVLFGVSFTPTWQNVSMSISRSSGACNLKMSSADVTDYPGKRILHFNKRFDLWSLRKINAKNANECEDLEGNAEIYLCDNVKSLDENVSKIGNVASDFS